MNWLITLIVAFTGGVLYRIGGSDWGNTKVRDLWLPTLGIGLLTYLGGFHWVYILCFGLYFGSLTTYWKKKGTDAKWWNWLLTGLGYSLAFLPFAVVSGLWLGFVLRCVIVSIGITIASEKIDNVVFEEFSRGFISTLTLPLLLL